MEDQDQILVPPPSSRPGVTKQDPFICPYCHQTVQVENEEDWIYHVYSDLRPYICTFGGCVKEDQLYDSFTEWSAHERQFHRREWFCTLCPYTSGAKSSFVHHLDDHHTDIPKEQRQEMENQSKSSTLAQQCPLCTKPPISNSSRFQQHLARHLQQLALFVLPRGETNDEDSAAREEESNESRYAFVADEDDIESILSISASLAGNSISGRLTTVDNRLLSAVPQETISDTSEDAESKIESLFSSPSRIPTPTYSFPIYPSSDGHLLGPILPKMMNDTPEYVGDETEGASTANFKKSTPYALLRREANNEDSAPREEELNESQQSLMMGVEDRESLHYISADSKASVAESSISDLQSPIDGRLLDAIPQERINEASDVGDSSEGTFRQIQGPVAFGSQGDDTVSIEHMSKDAGVQRSSSKSRRRDSTPVHYYPPKLDSEGFASYQKSTAVEPPPMDYPPYPFARPPMPDYPPSSPQTARYPMAVEEYHRPASRLARSDLSPSSMDYLQPSYDEHGPPPTSSAYASQYSSSPYGISYNDDIEYAPHSDSPRERSQSRTRERSQQPRARRSSSIYGQFPIDHSVFQDMDDDLMPKKASREMPPEYYRERPVPRQYHHAREDSVRDEDYYKMRPPPPPAPRKHKAQVHQANRPEKSKVLDKSYTIQANPQQQHHPSRTLTDTALPERGRRMSREARMPEHSHSLRTLERSNSYYNSTQGAQISVERPRNRRIASYYGDAGGLQDREREVKRYQVQQSGRTNTMPASTEALSTKGTVGSGSDNGSQKSRSNSSRGSGRGNGESKNMNLIVNGLTIGFTEESVAGKNISIRAEDTGRVQLSVAGDRRPKQYYVSGSSYFDQTYQTGRSGRRELEEAPRRPRDDHRSERASRRSNQSTYDSNRQYEM